MLRAFSLDRSGLGLQENMIVYRELLLTPRVLKRFDPTPC